MYVSNATTRLTAHGSDERTFFHMPFNSTKNTAGNAISKPKSLTSPIKGPTTAPSVVNDTHVIYSASAAPI